jgi:L-threonylcarbamoyladenylate synthase
VLTAGLFARVTAHLERGGVIAYATESCFGLGCDPRNARAIARLLRLKRRPKSKGLILIAADFDHLAPFVAPISDHQRARAAARWPGPHTWLLPASTKALPTLRGAHASLGVRVTAHRDAALLCNRLNTALVSTSANRSGLRPIKTYHECRRQFGSTVLTIPGRIGRHKRPSVIQDFKSGEILR